MSGRPFSISTKSSYIRAHSRLTTRTGFRYAANASAHLGQIVEVTSVSSEGLFLSAFAPTEVPGWLLRFPDGSFTPRSLPHHAHFRRTSSSSVSIKCPAAIVNNFGIGSHLRLLCPELGQDKDR